MIKKNIIVTPFFGSWAVMLNDKAAPISTHNLKSEAVKIANQLAKRIKSEVVIENSDLKKNRRTVDV